MRSAQSKPLITSVLVFSADNCIGRPPARAVPG
jgi:hypothetical protein